MEWSRETRRRCQLHVSVMAKELTAPRVLAIVLTLLVVGLFVPMKADPGLSTFRDDPVQYRVAMNALQGYWVLNRDLVARIIRPGARVTRVWREPGHCHDARATGETANYRAEVEGITWFGIPSSKVDATCGGISWSWRAARP